MGHAAEAALPERDYLLFRAPVAMVVDLAVDTAGLAYSDEVQGVDIVRWTRLAAGSRQNRPTWPDTLVAGSHSVIAAVLTHPDLHAILASADDQLTERT